MEQREESQVSLESSSSVFPPNHEEVEGPLFSAFFSRDVSLGVAPLPVLELELRLRKPSMALPIICGSTSELFPSHLSLLAPSFGGSLAGFLAVSGFGSRFCILSMTSFEKETAVVFDFELFFVAIG